MQQYTCQGCHEALLTVFDAYLHSLTNRGHVVFTLSNQDPEEIKTTVLYQTKGVSCPN